MTVNKAIRYNDMVQLDTAKDRWKARLNADKEFSESQGRRYTVELFDKWKRNAK